ncbi:putative baseplate assembly protein [Roseomonas sp. GCM10028921]
MKYFCCDQRRRDAVAAHPGFNGIDFLEVRDDPADPPSARQRVLVLHFVKPVPPGLLTVANLRISGGERIGGIGILSVTDAAPVSPPASPPGGGRVLLVEVDRAGDFSPYLLRLVRGPDEPADAPEPPEGFDPVLAAVEFSFKVACPADIDCRHDPSCPPEPRREPELDYLAKDYDSFRRLMLDRMAVLMPAWRERSAADLGIALVELLAHVGDQLSYQQDAVATEAYLGTARRRASVRRHARLVDYPMHEGRNARAFVQLRLRADVGTLRLPREVGGVPARILSQVEAPPLMAEGSAEHARARAQQPVVFELMEDAVLHAAHNRMTFHAWGAQECCLPKGATRATLRGALAELRPGMVLVLAEARGPGTGLEADADITRRHAVRLTAVRLSRDPLGDPLAEPPVTAPIPVTEIEWHREDALPFPLTVSARIGTRQVEEVSVALGNIVLADHGETRREVLPVVPAADPVLTKVAATAGDRCDRTEPPLTPPRFRPRLGSGPVTQAPPYDPAAPASTTLRGAAAPALAAVRLLQGRQEWFARRDLLNSRAADPDFVAEVEADGGTVLRFGDDRFGARPVAGTVFDAVYRTGSRASGNVGAEALAHLVTAAPTAIGDMSGPVIAGVSNPLPAQGGMEPESLEEVRQYAPVAFRRQERAVTPADYAEMAQRCTPEVQRAAGTRRWTGSWHTIFVTVDRRGGDPVDSGFEADLRRCLERYRMAGHDLEVDSPRFVPLELEARVCVKPEYFRADLREELLRLLGNRDLPDGRRGLFHPDRFSFGQPVHLGPVIAAIQAVPGVASVEVAVFQRQGIASDEAFRTGRLAMGRLEIARLDNDPDFRERGALTLDLRGGR